MEKLRAAFSEGVGESGALALLELDVTDRARTATAVGEAVGRFGTIDVLVNNAGFCVLGNFEDLDTSDFERQMATNFHGPVNLMHAALPVMRSRRSGHVINISSVAGGVGMSQCSAYSASKFALEGLSMAVSSEVERFGIHVTVVEPGFFRTSFLKQENAEVIETRIEDYAGQGSSREVYAAIDGRQLGDPEKLGEVLVRIAAMEKPPKLFAAGSDAVEMLRPAAEARLRAITAEPELSGSTDGDF
jgi:NAD(P)-dependent dehydrogenase (short-subunit alcohol dehydrogenase family)